MTVYKLVLKKEMISSNDELIIIEIDMRRIYNHAKNNENWSVNSSSSSSSSSAPMTTTFMLVIISTLSLSLHTYLHLITINVQYVYKHRTWFPLTLSHTHSKSFILVIDVCCFQSVRSGCWCPMLGLCKSFFYQFNGNRHCWKSFWSVWDWQMRAWCTMLPMTKEKQV